MTTIKLSTDELLLARAATIEAAEEREKQRWDKLYELRQSLPKVELEQITVEARLKAMRRLETEEQETGTDYSQLYSGYKRKAIDEIIAQRYLIDSSTGSE